MVCCDFSTEAINAYTDSAYVAGVLCAIETPYIGHTSNEELFHLFCQLQTILQAHHHPYFVGHLCATPVSWVLLLRATKMQTHLLLPLAFRDTLTPGSAVTQAVQSHALYHQNSNALCKQFVLPENRPDKLLKPAKSAHNTSPFH
jgi:hypothetical protein